MGRMKKNKPRRERPGDGIPRTTLDPAQAALHQWTTESADVLDLPTIASERETGRILEVAAVGIDGAGLFTGAEPAYVRCTDGKTFLLPESLRDWATTVVTTHLVHLKEGNPSLFPCRIEFGVLGGRAYAELL